MYIYIVYMTNIVIAGKIDRFFFNGFRRILRPSMRKRVLECRLSVCMYVRTYVCLAGARTAAWLVFVLDIICRFSVIMKFPAPKIGIFTGSTKHKVVIFSKTPETIFI
jgi:hypothetical protein